MKRRYKTNGLGIAFFMISLIKSAISIELPDDLKQEVNAYFHTAKPLCERILNRESYKTEESTLKLFEDLGTFLEDKEVPHLLKFFKDEEPRKIFKNPIGAQQSLLLNKLHDNFIPTIDNEELHDLTFITTLALDHHHIVEKYKHSLFLTHPSLWDIYRFSYFHSFFICIHPYLKTQLIRRKECHKSFYSLILEKPIDIYNNESEVDVKNPLCYTNTVNCICSDYALKGTICNLIIKNWNDKETTLTVIETLIESWTEKKYKDKVIVYF